MVPIKNIHISGLIHAIIFSLLFIMGIGSIGWLHIAWITGLLLFFLSRFGKEYGFSYNALQLNVIDISVLILFAFQVVVCLTSTYKPNSIFPLLHSLVFVIVYIYLKW